MNDCYFNEEGPRRNLGRRLEGVSYCMMQKLICCGKRVEVRFLLRPSILSAVGSDFPDSPNHGQNRRLAQDSNQTVFYFRGKEGSILHYGVIAHLILWLIKGCIIKQKHHFSIVLCN